METIKNQKQYSIVIPSFNEAGGIGRVIEELLDLKRSHHAREFEIIVVNDCSKDDTAHVVQKYPVTLISNVQNSGYGYSLKRGIASAQYDAIIILDADGTYPVSELPKLMDMYEQGFDMVVGARHGKYYHGTPMKRVARFFFRVLSEFVTGRSIPDINSGLRVFKREYAVRFFHTLSSGFSFTTTITLAFMLNSFSVMYTPVEYHKRKGDSKVRYFRDTLRSAQIIIEAIIYYNPLKIYMLSAGVVLCAGILSALISSYSLLLAALLFATVATSMLIVSLGFIVVFLRFMNSDQKRNAEHSNK